MSSAAGGEDRPSAKAARAGGGQAIRIGSVRIDVQITNRKSWRRWPGCGELCRRAARAAIRCALQASARGEMMVENWPSQVELGFILTDDDNIRVLNHRYRHRDQPTNVLAFAMEQPPCNDAPRMLGDVVIAFERVAIEAQQRGTEPKAHCALLAVHGVLHLLGYDHHGVEDAEMMRKLESRALDRLGYSASW